MTRHYTDLGSARNGFQEGLHPGGTYSRNKKCASKLAIPVLIKMERGATMVDEVGSRYLNTA